MTQTTDRTVFIPSSLPETQTAAADDPIWVEQPTSPENDKRFRQLKRVVGATALTAVVAVGIWAADRGADPSPDQPVVRSLNPDTVPGQAPGYVEELSPMLEQLRRQTGTISKLQTDNKTLEEANTQLNNQLLGKDQTIDFMQLDLTEAQAQLAAHKTLLSQSQLTLTELQQTLPKMIEASFRLGRVEVQRNESIEVTWSIYGWLPGGSDDETLYFIGDGERLYQTSSRMEVGWGDSGGRVDTLELTFDLPSLVHAGFEVSTVGTDAKPGVLAQAGQLGPLGETIIDPMVEEAYRRNHAAACSDVKAARQVAEEMELKAADFSAYFKTEIRWRDSDGQLHDSVPRDDILLKSICPASN
ncbi:MAG TPA: hypothetical protein VGA08_02195 [Candidatus Saccharimonadales bacterium]